MTTSQGSRAKPSRRSTAPWTACTGPERSTRRRCAARRQLPSSAARIRAGRDQGAREKSHLSEPVFARYLNTSESTVQKWETGAKRPSGMALKLLSVVQKHGLEVLR